MQLLQQGQYVGNIKREIRDLDLIVSVSEYDETLFHDQWHCHLNTHISFVVKGGCSERKKFIYDRLPGKATLYLCGEPHQILAMRNSAHLNLELTDNFFGKYSINETMLSELFQYSPDVKLLMVRIYKALFDADSCAATSVHILLLEFLHRATCQKLVIDTPRWINTLRDFLQANWDRAPSLNELSAVAGVHPVTVSAYFPKYFACTLGAYLRKLKIEHALVLLKTTTFSLTEIGYTCGFSDQSHFIRTFHQVTGFLPGQYRRI